MHHPGCPRIGMLNGFSASMTVPISSSSTATCTARPAYLILPATGPLDEAVIELSDRYRRDGNYLLLSLAWELQRYFGETNDFPVREFSGHSSRHRFYGAFSWTGL